MTSRRFGFVFHAAVNEEQELDGLPDRTACHSRPARAGQGAGKERLGVGKGVEGDLAVIVGQDDGRAVCQCAAQVQSQSAEGAPAVAQISERPESSLRSLFHV